MTLKGKGLDTSNLLKCKSRSLVTSIILCNAIHLLAQAVHTYCSACISRLSLLHSVGL